MKCGAVAELCSFTFDGPKLSGITAFCSLGAALCVPSSMKRAQQWILEARRDFFVPLPALLSTSSS